MFFKKPEAKSILTPCAYVAMGMIAAFGVVAMTKPGRKFVKSKISCLCSKLDSSSAS